MHDKIIPLQLRDVKFTKIAPNKKNPVEKDWPNKPYSYQEAEKWLAAGYNIGVLCGYCGVVVVDADITELSQFCLRNSPKTFTVKTSKGVHRYYFCPELKSTIRLQKNNIHFGEIMAKGAQVIAPPSTHPSGITYRVEVDEPITNITQNELFELLEDFMGQNLIDSLKNNYDYAVNDFELNKELTKKSYLPSEADIVAKECAFIKTFKKTGFEGNEPAWYDALGSIRHCPDGIHYCHKFSSADPNYNLQETHRKLKYLEQKNIKPILCKTIARHGYCSNCPHQDKILSPVYVGLIENTRNEDDWDDPILFDEIETPEIPASLLPPTLGLFAAALSIASETPTALSVMIVLGVVALIISRVYVVSPKEGWQESTNLYTIIGLPPANNKTLVLKTCAAPLSIWEKEQRTILEPQIKKQRSERKSREKIIETLRTKASKEKDFNTQENLIHEIAKKEAMLVEPQPLPCAFVTDITPEELATKMHEQKNYLGIVSDEGGITDVFAGLYSGDKANIDILLKGIDGGDVKIRRRDKNFDLTPFLTIILAVQPSVIRKMGEKNTFKKNGFLERFLYLLPKSKLGYRSHNTPSIPKELVENYKKLIISLLTSTIEKQKQLKQKIILTLSPEALASWKEFQQEIETQLRPNGKFYILQGWAGKISGFVLRIAAIIHVTEATGNSTIISVKSMANALEIGALLTQHAIAAYSLMGADETLHDAKELFMWIKSQYIRPFTQSDVTLAMRHRKLGKKERLAQALEILITRNILRKSTDNSTRKPTTIFLINPKIASDTDISSINKHQVAEQGKQGKLINSDNEQLSQISQFPHDDQNKIELNCEEIQKSFENDFDDLKDFLQRWNQTPADDKLIAQGIAPPHFTAITTCTNCGSVPVPPELVNDGQVDGCVWCFNRALDLPMPKINNLKT